MNDGPVSDAQFHTGADGATASQGVSGRGLLVELIDRIPTAEEHNRLFDSVGWSRYEVEELEEPSAVRSPGPSPRPRARSLPWDE